MNTTVIQNVLLRDGYQCLMCGSDYLVQLAHISSRGSRPDLRDEPSNVCVLCFPCHMQRMHKDGTLTKEALQNRMHDYYGFDY